MFMFVHYVELIFLKAFVFVLLRASIFFFFMSLESE